MVEVQRAMGMQREKRGKRVGEGISETGGKDKAVFRAGCRQRSLISSCDGAYADQARDGERPARFRLQKVETGLLGVREEEGNVDSSKVTLTTTQSLDACRQQGKGKGCSKGKGSHKVKIGLS